MSSLIKDLCNGFERLLTSCVPDLKLKHLLLKFDHKRAEFNTDCHFVVHNELICSHPMHQAALAHSRVSNDDQLEERLMIAIVRVHVRLGSCRCRCRCDNFIGHLVKSFHQLGRLGRAALIRGFSHDRCPSL